MDIYNYSVVTGEFISRGVADPNPLVAGAFLIPANATTQVPPNCESDEAAIFVDGEWEIVPDYRGLTYWLSDGQQITIDALGISPPADALFEAPPPPRNIAAEVAAHAIALKVGVVNATRTDGETDPATAEGLAAINERYKRIVDEFNTDMNLGDPVSDERKAVVRLIRSGHTFFAAVDAAAQTILAAGDAADPIASDTRWPAIPAAD